MAIQTQTALARIKKWRSASIGAQFWIINKSIQMEDKLSFIRATTPSIVIKEPLLFNISTLRAKLVYPSDQRWDRAMLFLNDVPVIATHVGDTSVADPTRTADGLAWLETVSSNARIGVPYEQLWWFNSADEIEVHRDIWQVGGARSYTLSYNKLTQYISYNLVLGDGESWYIDWQLYNRRTINRSIKETVEEVLFDEETLTAELIRSPIQDKTTTILYKQTGVTITSVPAEQWYYGSDSTIAFYRRDYLDTLSRYTLYFQYWLAVESPVIDYTVELSQSLDNGENWTDWEEIEREFLIDKSKGLMLRYRLTVDIIDDIDSFRFKSFAVRKVRDVI
jgi:hypothetical protein